MWYNVIIMKKKPVKTINKKKLEHRKTAVKPVMNDLSVDRKPARSLLKE